MPTLIILLFAGIILGTIWIFESWTKSKKNAEFEDKLEKEFNKEAKKIEESYDKGEINSDQFCDLIFDLAKRIDEKRAIKKITVISKKI